MGSLHYRHKSKIACNFLLLNEQYFHLIPVFGKVLGFWKGLDNFGEQSRAIDSALNTKIYTAAVFFFCFVFKSYGEVLFCFIFTVF